MRQGYTVLDMLGDFGGIYGIFVLIGSVIVNFANRDYLDNYIVSKLFKMEKEVKEDPASDPGKLGKNNKRRNK